MHKYNSNDLVNETRVLVSDLYKLKTGKYELKNGILYDNKDKIVSDKEYVKASGLIFVDKYNNVKFVLNKDNYCISKTYVGETKFEENVCGEEKKVEVSMIKNNATISFESEVSPLYYMVSSNDDFKGEWIKAEDDKNIIIKTYREGNNYIWFKDEEGNLSNTMTFKVDCLYTNNANYNSSVFYCTGSTVYLDKMKWVVLEDTNNSVKLMRYLPLDSKMAHCPKCDKNCDIFCTEENYKWSNSYINYYLNNEFIYELSEDTINKLSTFKICNDYENNKCDEDICGGRLENEIKINDWKCSDYEESYIKVISYDEFNYAYIKTRNKEAIRGNYWGINSFDRGLGSSVLDTFNYYVVESPTTKLDVRPVIIINK